MNQSLVRAVRWLPLTLFLISMIAPSGDGVFFVGFGASVIVFRSLGGALSTGDPVFILGPIVGVLNILFFICSARKYRSVPLSYIFAIGFVLQVFLAQEALKEHMGLPYFIWLASFATMAISAGIVLPKKDT